MLRRQISGLILASVSHDHLYLASWAAQIPVVFVDRPPQNLQADSVTEDDANGATEAVSGADRRGPSSDRLLGACSDRGDASTPPRPATCRRLWSSSYPSTRH